MADVRRISVALSASLGNYARTMIKATAVTDGLSDSLDKLAMKSKAAFADVEESFQGLGEQVEKTSTRTKTSLGGAGKAVSDFDRLVKNNLQDEGTAFEAVGRSIDQYKAKIVALKEEANRVGSASAFNDLERAKADLTKLEAYAAALGPVVAKQIVPKVAKAGEDAGKNFVEKFGGALSNLPLVPSNPYVAAALGAVGIAMAPPILAALEGALGAGVGVGGLAIGIAASFRTAPVQNALTGLKYDAGAIFTEIGQSFAGPVSAGVDDLDKVIHEVGPELKSTFAAIAPSAKVLIDGLGGFIQGVLPGLEDGFQNAQPLVSELAADLPTIGHDVGKMIDEFTEGGPGAVDALHDLITAVGDVAIGVGWVTKASAQTFRVMEFGIDAVTGKWDNLTSLLSETTSGTGSLTDAVNGFSEAADHGSKEVDQLNTEFTKWLTTAENADNAILALDRAHLTFVEGLKKGTKAWNENTKAGQTQVGNLNDVVQALTRKYDGMKVDGMLTDAQTKQELAYAQSLYNTAKAAGASKPELATLKGIIDDLSASVAKMPPAKKITVTAPGLDSAIKKTQSLHDLIYNIPPVKPVTFDLSIRNRKVLNQLGQTGANRWGGLYTHALDGALRDADVYSPVSAGARYAFAEPATGGEGFVPKYGNYARSTAIIDTEARWYGGRFVPNGGGSGGGSQSSYSPSLNFNVYPQQANWSVHDQLALQATAESMMQVGRAW